MAEYVFAMDAALQNDLAPLQAECQAAGLPVTHVNGSPDTGTIQVHTSRDLTPAEVATLDGIVSGYDGRPRRPRPLYAIWQDINALTGAQKTNVGNDLFGGTPSKLSQDTGPNAPDLLIISTLRQLISLSTADKRLLETDAIAIYVGDQPRYLDPCLFDPTIPAIPGDEPYTP